jgi:RND family efflux transporter MFP subunit
MKKIIPVVIVVIFAGAVYFAKTFKPEVEKRNASVELGLVVDSITVERKPFPIEIQSFGRVQPRTHSTLLPQVSGEIIEVSANFRDGGFFEKGEVLVVIDPRDYEAAVKIAESSLEEARLALSEEQAQSKQALVNWKRLDPNTKEAPDLVLRKPQLAAARAKMQSAEAQLEQARLNLARTQIKAPFAGRVLTQNADLGQVVSSSTNLADLYAIDYVEVRLPLKNNDLRFVELPESYRFTDDFEQRFADVTIINRMGTKGEEWQAKLLRTEGAVDETSHQLYVIAQIDDPYGVAAESKRPLKIGQYVSARIQGITVPDALVIPKKAVYQDSYVYVLEGSVLNRRDIELQWQDEHQALVSSGIKAGDRLITTPLGQVTSGTRVKTPQQKTAQGDSP